MPYQQNLFGVGESPVNQLGLAVLSPMENSGGFSSYASSDSSYPSYFSAPAGGHSKCIEHGHHHITYPLNAAQQKQHEMFGCSFDPRECSEFDCDSPGDMSPQSSGIQDSMLCNAESIYMQPDYHHRTYPYTEDEQRRFEEIAERESTVSYWEESQFFWPSTSSEPSSLGARPSQVNVNISPDMATNINIGTSTPGGPSFNLPRSKISTPKPSSRISETSPPSRMASGARGPHISRESTPSGYTSGSSCGPHPSRASSSGGISRTSPPSSMASGQSGSRISRASTPGSMASGQSGSRISRASTPGSMASGQSGSRISRASTPGSMASGQSGSRISRASPPSSLVSGPCSPHISQFSSPSGMASGASSGGSSRYYTASSSPSMESSSLYVTGSSSLPSMSLEGSPAPCGALYKADAVYGVTASGSTGQILQALDNEHAMEKEKILSNLKRYQSARRKFLAQ